MWCTLTSTTYNVKKLSLLAILNLALGLLLNKLRHRMLLEHRFFESFIYLLLWKFEVVGSTIITIFFLSLSKLQAKASKSKSYSHKHVITLQRRIGFAYSQVRLKKLFSLYIIMQGILLFSHRCLRDPLSDKSWFVNFHTDSTDSFPFDNVEKWRKRGLGLSRAVI